MSRVAVSLLALLATAIVNPVDAKGPSVVYSKTSYELKHYAENNIIFRHFTFTFDQPLFIKDRYGTTASVADPAWYLKKNSTTDVELPRVLCMSEIPNGIDAGPRWQPWEPSDLGPLYYGQYFAGFTRNPHWFRYAGCAPYIFRALDGNFILTDIRKFVDPIQLAGNFHFTYAVARKYKPWIPLTVRLPDYDGTALYPGIVDNDRGYNFSTFYWDIVNYRANEIPFDLIDTRTLILTDIYWTENLKYWYTSFTNNWPDTVNYGSMPALAGRNYYSHLWYGNGITLLPQLSLLCNTNTEGLPKQQQLMTFDHTWSYFIPGAQRALLLNEAGEQAISGAPANVHYNFASCNLKDLEELNKKYAAIQAEMLKTTNPQALTTLQLTLKTLHSQFPFDACFIYIASLYNTTTSEIEIEGRTDCQHQYGTFDYARDPCCNFTLSFSQCCAPKTIKQTTTVATQISDGTQCIHPSAAFTAIQTLVSGLNAGNDAVAASSPSDKLASNSFSELIAFQAECQSILYNTTCSTDSQCQYGSSCDLTDQLCIPPYDAVAESTLACYSDKMDRDLKNRLIAQLGVEFDSNDQPITTDFINKFSAAVFRDDCVGPTASEYRTRYQYTDDGHIVMDQSDKPVIIPGDQEACLAAQQCAFTTDAGQTCSASPTSGQFFCGLCNDNSCVDITRPAQCVVTLFRTPNSCAAAGLYWQTADSSSIASRYFPSQNGYCLDLSANTEEKCLDSTFCAKPTSEGDSWTRCAQPFCYSTTYSSKQACEAHDGDWEPALSNGKGLCTDAFDPEDDDNDDDYNNFLQLNNSKWKNYLKAFFQRQADNSGCEKGFRRFSGRIFIPGKFDTAEKCAAGQCSIRNENGQNNFDTDTLPADKCSQLQQCSTTCPRCRSSFAVDSSAASELVCYEVKDKKGIKNAKQCRRDGGVWTRLSDKSFICRYQLDKAACLAKNHQVADCSGLTKDSCYSGDSPIDQLLQCQWSTTASCPIDSCSQQGFCNDAEFINHKVPAGRNGAQPSGACLVPSPIERYTIEPNACQLNPSLFNSTVHLFQTASRIAGLCLDFTVDKATCSSLGFSFQDVATTAADCAAHGSNCFESDGRFTGKSAQHCENCGGKSVSAYRWTRAKVEAGFIRTNTQWKARELISINSWKPTVVFPLLDELIHRVAIRKVAVEQISAISLSMSTILSMMNSLACDCTTNVKTLIDQPWEQKPYLKLKDPSDMSCYTQPPVQQAIGDIVPGSAIQLFTTNAVVFIDPATGTGLTKTLQLGLVSASSLSGNLSAFAIQDSTGSTVAYLAGNGLNLNDSLPAGTVTTVLQYEGSIGTAIPTEFNSAGIAQLIDGQLQLLESDAVFVNGKNAVQTSTINEKGSYFPVKVTQQTQVALAASYSAKFAKHKTSDAKGMTSVGAVAIVLILTILQLLF